MKIPLKALLFAFLISLPATSYCQTTPINNFVLLEYGLRHDNEFRNARWVVGDKWGITFDQVAGCFVSEKLIDSVKLVNAFATVAIIKAYGSGWKTKFDNEVQAEVVRQEQARLLVLKQSFIQKKEKQLKAAGNGINILLSPKEDTGSYSAKVYGYGEWKGKSALVVFYKVNVDLEKESATLESDKPEPLR